MDALQTYLSTLLRADTYSSFSNTNSTLDLPLPLALLLPTSATTALKTLTSYASNLTQTLHTLLLLLTPYLPTTLPTTPGEFFSLILLALALIMTFKIVDYVRRVVVAWVLLAVKLIVVILLLQLGAYIYVNGVEQSLRQMGWIWGYAEGIWDGLGQGNGGYGKKGSSNPYGGARRQAGGRGKWS